MSSPNNATHVHATNVQEPRRGEEENQQKQDEQSRQYLYGHASGHALTSAVTQSVHRYTIDPAHARPSTNLRQRGVRREQDVKSKQPAPGVVGAGVVGAGVVSAAVDHEVTPGSIGHSSAATEQRRGGEGFPYPAQGMTETVSSAELPLVMARACVQAKSRSMTLVKPQPSIFASRSSVVASCSLSGGVK